MATNTNVPGTQSIPGKKLSATAEQIEQAAAAKHTHSNKSILDQIDHVPLDGADGADGQDGASAYELAVEAGFEGTLGEWLASLKGEDGRDGTDGSPGQDGVDGADGYTPVKGTDYFTDADKAEIVQDVLAALPTWTGGSY